MAIYRIHMVGGAQFDAELFYEGVDDVAFDASRSRFITGQIVAPDESGQRPLILISTSRIQCVIATE